MRPREDLLLTLERGRSLLEVRLRQASDGGQAAAVADGLRAVWPGLRLSYCRLPCAGTVQAHAVDGTGTARPEWAESLGEAFVLRETADGAGKAEARRVPAGLALKGTLYWVKVPREENEMGGLVVLFPEEFTARQKAVGGEILSALGRYLGQFLLLEGARRRERELVEEQVRNIPLCALADMMGPFSHEVQNVFNGIVLQSAILGRDVPEELSEKVELIRKLALQAADMLKQLDAYRYALPVPRRAVDLNRVVKAVVDALQVPGEALACDLGQRLPAVRGSETTLRRLVWLLVAHARSVIVAEEAAESRIVLKTSAAGGKVFLRVEDGVPLADPEALKSLFEPFVLTRPGENSLELAACQAIVRKLGGVIRAEKGDDGGVAVVVEFDQAPEG